MKTILDKIGSSTARLGLPREVEVSPHVEAKEGNVLAVRALMEKSVYDRLELTSGRMAKINKGDVLAGTLGYRRALKGFVGTIPESIHVGDTIHVLNLGGVLGVCIGKNPDVGAPLEVEVLGSVMLDGKPANISKNALLPREDLPECPPLVVVAGTCMSAGKTGAASELVKRFAQAGTLVAATSRLQAGVCPVTFMRSSRASATPRDAFVSTAPRPCTRPSRVSPLNGSPIICSTPTVSRCTSSAIHRSDRPRQMPTSFRFKPRNRMAVSRH